MLVKCESKSHRVKGVSFHPRLSWVLVSLHNGVIQLWDYRLGCLIEKFEEHYGPVRGVDFHKTQPLFVSGGDDHKIKVWDYKQKKSVFTLNGHLDYIRTVQFHAEYPWICSAADDQTVRIWNWQSRHCIAVLAGHHHYIMCATFHPTEDLLASASLDQTIRIWDLSGLREKTVSGTRGNAGVALGGSSSEIFGATDAVSKFILEGHDRGVNWVTFHPTSQMLVSAADDRLIKLWRYDEHKWWEIDTLRGHFNNVSCVIFHPQKDIIVSNSEDRTIRIWDLSRRVLLHTYRRDNDRFWILASHPHNNLLAVGHDSGMVVFKLDRERPPVATWMENGKLVCLHTKDTSLLIQTDAAQSALEGSFADSDSRQNVQEFEIGNGLVRRPSDALSGHPHHLLRNPCNSAELNVAILYGNVSGGDCKFSYDLHTISQAAHTLTRNARPSIRTESGTCNAFAFCARNKFLTIDAQGQLYMHTMSGAAGELRRKVELPAGLVPDDLFFAGSNRVLIRAEDTVVLYDVVTRKRLGEINCALAGTTGANGRIRQAIWSPQSQYVALLSKHYVILAKSNLVHVASAHECIRVKSGVWDEHNSFIYNTVSHLKYLLTNGDNGIYQSIPEGNGVYIQAMQWGKLFYLTRRSTLYRTSINVNEQLLKVALSKGKMEVVAALLKNQPAKGNVWVGYLKRKGFPEVAYHCVRDPATRAMLATEFFDLDAATEAVTALNNPVGWKRLGEVALKLGNVTVAERSNQKARRYDKLIYLYMLTGNLEKLEKLGAILNDLGDRAAAFHISLLTGNVEERVQILLAHKKASLAYVTARRHGLDMLATDIGRTLSPEQLQKLDASLAKLPPGNLLTAPLPLHRERQGQDWPLKAAVSAKPGAVVTGAFEALLKNAHKQALDSDTVMRRDLVGSVDTVPVGPGEYADAASEDEAAFDTKAWVNEDEEDDWFGVEGAQDAETAVNTTGTLPGSGHSGAKGGEAPGDADFDEFVVKGTPLGLKAIKAKAQPSIGDLVAVGDFREAFALLDRRIGLVNGHLMVPIFQAAFQAAQYVIPTLPLLGGLRTHLLQKPTDVSADAIDLRSLMQPSFIGEVLKQAIVLFSARKLEESRAQFHRALLSAALSTASNQSEEMQIIDQIKTARHYMLAIDLENAKQQASSLPPEQRTIRELEIVILTTWCHLQPLHRFYFLKEASRIAIKSQNYITGAALVRKVLQEDFAGKIKSVAPEVEKLKGALAQCERFGKDAITLSVDTSDQLQFCASDLAPIGRNEDTVTCSFCSSVSRNSFRGKACRVCAISELGRHVLGMQFKALV